MVDRLKPWLWLPPHAAHDLSQKILPLLPFFTSATKTPQFGNFSWQNLSFENPIGIAGGVDKNGATLLAWQNFGAGFLEVGTITPKVQGPNPGAIIDRNLQTHALWNRMGFPNAGADATLQRIRKNRSKIRVPLFVNIGKNRDTPNEKAYEDYRHCLRVLDEIADAFVINISSPNTKGLRELLLPENFRTFVKNIFRDKVSSKPWLLKLSPDLEPSDLQNVLATACEVGCNGFILTNTKANEQRYFPHREGGGVSGGPLKPFSEEFLLQTSEYLTKHSIRDKLIVSVGGIESAEDVMKRLQNGADLVQVYSALIFEGPGFFRRTIKELNWQSGEKSDPTGYL